MDVVPPPHPGISPIARIISASPAPSFNSRVCLLTNDRRKTRTIPPANPTRLIDEMPADDVFTVVVAVTVTVAVPEVLKSTVWLFTGSVEVTTQLAFGAVVVQENATRPVPIVPSISTVVVLPVVAPAVTVIDPLGVSEGAGTVEGRYWRT